MSKYKTIWAAVRFGTLKDVIEIFKKGDKKIGDASGDSILFHALANTNSIAHYKITNFLINISSLTK
jgi:putative ankyrin repeat protein